MVRGSAEWWVKTQIFDLEPGDLFVTQPGEEHGGGGSFMHPCELFWVHIKPRNALLQQLSQVRQRHFKDDASMTTHFARLLAEHRLNEQHFVGQLVSASMEKRTSPIAVCALDASRSSTRSVAAARGVLHLLVVDTLRFHDAAESAPTRAATISPPILAAMELLQTQLDSADCLLQAARRAGLRGTQFRKRFQAESGFSPQEYLMRTRLQNAKRRLTQNTQTVTEIAFTVGFSSSQYFATAFRQHIGLTPQEFRLRHTHRD